MKIPFTNIEFNLRKQDSNRIEVDQDYLKAFIETNSKFMGSRPQLDPTKTIGDDEILIPVHPLPMDIIYDVAHYSDVLRTVHQNLRKEIFRLGYEIQEIFASKCEECGKEFQNQTDECDECKSTNLREPEVEQRKMLTNYCKNMNDNDQDLVHMSEELEDDHNTIDDGYLLCIKDYYWTDQGELLGAVPVEFLRSDPRYMRLIADKTGRPAKNQNGDTLYFCPEHRNTLHHNSTTCDNCGRGMFKAYYRSEKPDGEHVYYGKDEICHKSKYNPSLTYGFSVIYSVWLKVVTLMNMDRYMNNYYAKQRPPRGLLFVDTPNMASLEKAWNWMLDEFKKNPHQIPPIGIERQQGGRGKFVEFIDLMRSMDEMQFTETRNEFRRQIGAIYGVMPLFQADLSDSGGLNNEGLQITVTNRAIKDGQGVYDDGYYPWICDQLGVTDYKIVLNPNEEQDLVAKEDLKFKKITNAKLLQDMGFEVTMNEDEDFEFEPIDEPVERPAGFEGGFNPGQQDSDQSFSGMPKVPGPQLGGGGMGKSIAKKKGDNAEYDQETEEINESKKTCKFPHKFKKAKWTYPNGHPRCKVCGHEERMDGKCDAEGD